MHVAATVDKLKEDGRSAMQFAAVDVHVAATVVATATRRSVTNLLLCGDVMLGRGIDQILKYPSDPTIYESYLKSAVDYIRIAEKVNGPIPRGVPDAYVWGDVPQMLREAGAAAPDAIIVNLETSVTASDDYWRGKSINYRMEPRNAVPVLQALGVDCAVLANNHILDWGYEGMAETFNTLHAGGILTAGAGPNRAAALAPAIIELDGGRRVLVFSLASSSSGVPPEWAASAARPGVALLEGPERVTVAELQAAVLAHKRAGDVAVASIHWGGNWGYDVPAARQRTAHALIEQADFDLIHDHSSNHPISAEVHRGRLILYGCGDFVNDYEGIEHHYAFRGDLALAFLPSVDSGTGELRSLEMWPLQIRQFQLVRAQPPDAAWLAQVMDRECAKFGGRVELHGGVLRLRW